MIGCLLLTVLCGVSRAEEPVYDIDIPTMDAAEALNRFAEQTGAIMLFPYDLASARQANAVSGRYTLLEGLDLLLQDTGLSGGLSDKRVVNISPAGDRQRSAGESDMREQSASLRKRIAAVAASILSASAASGQEPRSEAKPLEEIIVTARKRAESLQDAPLAVSAISAADIQARGLTQYADYLNSMPGVYFEDTGPGVSQIRIRGVVASEGLGPATVATYFGETLTSVLTLFGGKPNLRLVDIDRVELLRGPQGTLFGANSLSGVVRIVPVAPDTSGFEASVGTRGFATAHSSDISNHVEGVVNFPLIQGRLALRLVGYRDDIAGYIDNVVEARSPLDYSAFFGLPDETLVQPANPAFTSKDINSEETWGARAALAWDATDRLRLDLTYATQSVELGSEPQVVPAVGDYLQSRALDLFSPGLYLERLDVSTLVLNYDWQDVFLTSASSFTRMKSERRDDLGALVEGIFGFTLPWENRTASDGEVFTQEVRLQSQGDGPLQWLAGAFYLDQQADFVQVIPDYSCPACIPTAFFGQDFAFRKADPRYLNQKQRSVFGEVSYRVAPRWTVGIGARYLEEDLEAPSPALEGFFVDGFVPASEANKGSSHELNPSAYVRFEATEDMTLYAQAARGFRSGVTNNLLSYTGTCADEAAAIGLGPLAEPDTLWNYELGMKSRFMEGRLGVNLAVYKQDWQGVQLDATLGGDCNLDGIVNGGDVGGEGAELEVTARLSAAWRANLAAAFTHNEFDAVSPGLGFEVGERLSGAPERNGSAGLQYDLELNERWSGFARADYVYVGSARYKFNPFDPVVVNQDAYDATNVRVGMRRDSLSIELFGRNITDERSVVATGSPTAGGYQYLLRPREIGIDIRYVFR